MNFSFYLIFKNLHFLLPAPSHPSVLFTPKSGFPHALKHGGFPQRVCEGREPAGTFQGFHLE